MLGNEFDLQDVVEGLYVRSIVQIYHNKVHNPPKVIMGYDEEDVLKRARKAFAESVNKMAYPEDDGGIPTPEMDKAWKNGRWQDDYDNGCSVEVHDPTLYVE